MSVVKLMAGGELQHVAHRQALEADRLLEGIGDAELGAFRDVHVGDLLPLEKEAARGGGLDAGDQFGERRFTAAVGACDHHELPALEREIDVFYDACPVGKIPGEVFEL